MLPEAAVLVPEYPVDFIEKETNFWRVTVDNQVIFPRWDKIGFSKFWWDYYIAETKRELVCVGRGGGKGWNLIFRKVVRAFLKYAEVKASGIRYTGAQWHLLIVAPTAENFSNTVAKLIEMVPHVPGYAPDGHLNYRFRNSDTCDFRLFGNNELLITVLSTYDADTMRGKDADDLLVDEAFMVDQTAITDVLIQVVQRQGRPPQGGYFTAAGTPDTEDLKDPWFDNACDQADPKKPEVTGFFDNFTLYEADFTVNPFMSDDLWNQILREALLNLKKWQRERLAIRGLSVENDQCGNVFTQGMVEACWYMEQPINIQRPCAAIDLAFGNQDSLARIWYDITTGTVYDLEIWLPKEQQAKLGIIPKAYDKGIVDLFNGTAARHPGLPIVYDANSENYAPVAHLVPRHLRTIPIRKNQHSKAGLVKLLDERFAMVDATGKNTSLRMPHPDAPWLNDTQRENFERLYREIVEYRVEYSKTPLGDTKVRYNKPEKGSDDALDALLLLMTQSEPQRPANLQPLRRRGRSW